MWRHQDPAQTATYPKLSSSTERTDGSRDLDIWHSPSLLEAAVVGLIGRRQHDAAAPATVLARVQLAVPDGEDVTQTQVRCSEESKKQTSWVDSRGPFLMI